MKKWNILTGMAIALVLAAAIGLSSSRAQQNRFERQQAGVVIIQGDSDYDSYPYRFVVFMSSSGPNAPKLKSGDDLAAALESLVGQGYKLNWVGGFTCVAVRE